MIAIFIRHAERQPTGTDPGLSPAGKRRAQLLATMFEQSGVASIFTSRFKRTKETAAPLAATLGLTPRVIDENAATAKTQILGAGAVVLVVGHSDTVPELIGELGGPSDLEIDDAEFDRMFVLTVNPAGDRSLLQLRYISA